MNGCTVRFVRKRYDLDVSEMSLLLGVAPSIVSRWESTDRSDAKLDANSKRVLFCMSEVMLRNELKSIKQKSEFISKVKNTIHLQGGLRALFVILSVAYENDRD